MDSNSTWYSRPSLAKSLVVLSVLLSLFVAAKAIAEVKGYRYIGNQYNMSTISVSGKGEIVVVPDIATFSFSIVEEGASVAAAQKEATEKTNAILAFLEESGVEEKDVKTTNYSIYPRYEYPNQTYYSSGERTLAAYVVSQSVEIKVRDTDEAGELLTGIGEYGASDVSGLNFTVDNYDDKLKEARELAIQDARDNAKKLAGDLGVRLVRVQGYYDQGPIYPMYYGKDMAMNGAYGGEMRAESAPQLPAGENKIIANVNITYEIR